MWYLWSRVLTQATTTTKKSTKTKNYISFHVQGPCFPLLREEKYPAEKDKTEEKQLSLSHHHKFSVLRVWGDLSPSCSCTHIHHKVRLQDSLHLEDMNMKDNNSAQTFHSVSSALSSLCSRDLLLDHTARINLRHC